MSPANRFLGLTKKEWGRLAQYQYDLDWQERNPGVLWDSTVLQQGFSNNLLQNQMAGEAVKEAEKVLGKLKYERHPDRAVKKCDCCGRSEYVDE